MPANLSPEFKIAEQKFRAAATDEAKLVALEDMLSAIPKHKGTEKMQADIKRRISKLRGTLGSKSGAARSKPVYLVEREGAGQIALVGPPNSGKSSLLDVLTGAEPEIANYPFTTRLPMPGMVVHENVQLQLIDLPPLAAEGSPPWLASALRLADVLALVFDVSSDDLLTEVEETLSLLAEFGIRLSERTSPDRKEMMAVVIGTKVDRDPTGELSALLAEAVGRPVVRISTLSGDGLDLLAEALYRALGIIRVYTKAPGKKPDLNAPFVLKRGASVLDAARAVHKDIASNLKSARLWNDRLCGLMVSRDHSLEDGDVIEFRS